MLIFLWSRATFISLLPQTAVAEGLSDIVEEGDTWKPLLGIRLRAGAPFAGKVTERGFHFVRRTRYRDPTRPIVSGLFEPDSSGTRIRVLVWAPLAQVVTIGLFVAAGVAAASRGLTTGSVALAVALLLHAAMCVSYSIDRNEALTAIRKAARAVDQG